MFPWACGVVSFPDWSHAREWKEATNFTSQFTYLQFLLSSKIPLKGSVLHSLNWISHLPHLFNLTCVPIAGRKKVAHQSVDQNEFGNANDQLF